MKTLKTLKTLTNRLLALPARLHDAYLYGLAVGTVYLLMPHTANAQAAGLGAIVQNLTSALSGTPQLLSDGAYISGAGLGFSGLHGLNKHFQQPQQFPWHAAAAKLGIGGGLIAFPFVLSSFSQTLSGGASGTVTVPQLPSL